MTKKVIERNLNEGAAGLFVGGSSAECFLLSHEERLQCFSIGAQFAEKTSLIAHVGAISTDEAIDFAKAAKAMGYHAIAATPPFYYSFSSSAVAQYYYDISKAADMPVMIYNFPGNTSRPFALSDTHTRNLFLSDAIFGVKHTNLDLFQLERIQALNPNLQLFNGFDETMLCGYPLNLKGSIGSTFNFMLPHYLEISRLLNSGLFVEARDMQRRANNIMEAICSVGLISAIKYILNKQGYNVGHPRRPFTKLTEEQSLFIDKILEDNLFC